MMKKRLITLLLTGACFLLVSCGDEVILVDDSESSPSNVSDRDSSENIPSEDDSSEKTFEQIVDELCQGEYVQDSTGTEVPNTDYLPLPAFQTLPVNAIFNVRWNTTEGSYTSGTSFLMKTDLSEEPLLVTALHCFGKDTYVSGTDLPDYVKGGELHDILKNSTAVDGSIDDVLLISDAVAYGELATANQDLAAFTLSSISGMNSFPIATEPCQPGDLIFLAARLSNSQYIYDNCLYPCVVIADNGYDLYYTLNDAFDASDARGCPLLNDRGEVVGIHIASADSLRHGHSAQSIYEQLKGAFSAQ